MRWTVLRQSKRRQGSLLHRDDQSVLRPCTPAVPPARVGRRLKSVRRAALDPMASGAAVGSLQTRTSGADSGPCARRSTTVFRFESVSTGRYWIVPPLEKRGDALRSEPVFTSPSLFTLWKLSIGPKRIAAAIHFPNGPEELIPLGPTAAKKAYSIRHRPRRLVLHTSPARPAGTQTGAQPSSAETSEARPRPWTFKWLNRTEGLLTVSHDAMGGGRLVVCEPTPGLLELQHAPPGLNPVGRRECVMRLRAIADESRRAHTHEGSLAAKASDATVRTPPGDRSAPRLGARLIVATYSTLARLDMMVVWATLLARNGVADRFLLLDLDGLTCQAAEPLMPAGMTLTCVTPAELAEFDDASPADVKPRRAASAAAGTAGQVESPAAVAVWDTNSQSQYFKYMRLKLVLLKALVELRYAVLLTDVDVLVLNARLVSALQHHGHGQDLLISEDSKRAPGCAPSFESNPLPGYASDWVCAGLMLARPTPAARRFFRLASSLALRESLLDQDAIQVLLTGHVQVCGRPTVRAQPLPLRCPTLLSPPPGRSLAHRIDPSFRPARQWTPRVFFDSRLAGVCADWSRLDEALDTAQRDRLPW